MTAWPSPTNASSSTGKASDPASGATTCLIGRPKIYMEGGNERFFGRQSTTPGRKGPKTTSTPYLLTPNLTRTLPPTTHRSKSVVALVMSRHRHHSACAVAPQHIVRHPDR